MKAVHEDLIRQRAYEIWESQGRPLGLDKEHWEQAERELLDAAPGIEERAAASSAASNPSGADLADTDQGQLGRDATASPGPRILPRGDAPRAR